MCDGIFKLWADVSWEVCATERRWVFVTGGKSADCSQGPIPQVVPKNKSNKQLTETPLEAYVSSTLYEVEEERVGVPVKRRLYEVPSFFAVLYDFHLNDNMLNL